MISPSDILHGKVLIVDDQEANILLLERMLRGAGYVSIESTMDPNEVCALHRKNRYDLILLDLLMPGTDGFQVMEGLKEIEAGGYLPVLVITAQPDHKLRALKAGAKDFVSKPLDLAEVLARVHNMLEVRLLHLETKKLYDQLVAEQKRSIELSLQPGAMVGVENEERITTHWFRSLMLRHHWLQINLLTTFVAAAVVGLFQGTIDRLLILTIFLPVLVGQSLSTGSQALAITLRGISLGDLESGKEKALVRKEALLGLLNGALVGLVAAIGMYVVATVQHLPNAPMLSAVVFLAMIGSCVISGICGAIVPLILKRRGVDPATASSIFLSTVTDVASMGMLLGLAAVLVK
ncbi:MAG: magnesium transporter [Sulfuricella sp.]